MSTGQRIKAARIKAGMTQAELAEKLHIPYQSVSKWERDLRKPKFETLQRIAKALNIEVQALDERFATRVVFEDFFKDGPAPSRMPDFLFTNSDGNFIQISMETVVGQLIYSFSNLNEIGQQEAVRRVDELTEVPKYQRKNSLNNKE
ncbi:helix-turn-helix transcriptional regulator [Flavonifractor sp. An306]|uniref:helix-turn-helix domain-containing protein n=1 Tax=Flavonifractor sp. An306 TaxID=1965629 RepID=UPI000B3AE6E2|nr:helix-turn-helix transcriptional regulator [Flavonifractor sp. An306]OUO35685.1 hypothetical protein B5F88_14755 [Flavonifractor sp. An306]